MLILIQFRFTEGTTAQIFFIFSQESAKSKYAVSKHGKTNDPEISSSQL